MENYSSDYARYKLEKINNPMDCIIRTRCILTNKLCVTSEELKKMICDVIDESGHYLF